MSDNAYAMYAATKAQNISLHLSYTVTQICSERLWSSMQVECTSCGKQQNLMQCLIIVGDAM